MSRRRKKPGEKSISERERGIADKFGVGDSGSDDEYEEFHRMAKVVHGDDPPYAKFKPGKDALYEPIRDLIYKLTVEDEKKGEKPKKPRNPRNPKKHNNHKPVQPPPNPPKKYEEGPDHEFHKSELLGNDGKGSIPGLDDDYDDHMRVGSHICARCNGRIM
jgi:hypothetical protein